LKITSELLKNFGSGVVLEDEICMNGYYFTMSVVEKLNGDATVGQIQEEIRKAIDLGTVDEFSARSWLLWSHNLSKNPDAIEYWNNAEYLNEFCVQDRSLHRTYFSDLQSAKQYKKTIINDFSENFFERINVLKTKKISENKSTSISVKHIEEITEGFVYQILDEVTGNFIDCDSVPVTISVVENFKNRLLEDLEKELVIYQKIKDPDEGFTAWKRIKT
jgi:hypothetical protein